MSGQLEIDMMSCASRWTLFIPQKDDAAVKDDAADSGLLPQGVPAALPAGAVQGRARGAAPRNAITDGSVGFGLQLNLWSDPSPKSLLHICQQ